LQKHKDGGKQMKSRTHSLSFSFIIVILTALAALSCGTGNSKNGQQFCDSCEADVLKEVFEIDTIHVFYKDYSGLNNIKDAVLPIKDRYLDSISLQKYLTDTSVTNRIPIGSMEVYHSAMGGDSILQKKNYSAFEKALFSPQEISSYIKGNELKKYIRISKPIFSENGNYVLIEIDYYCNISCGEGYTYILKKTDNGWVLYKKIFRWVV
jgi:hypothetical protein